MNLTWLESAQWRGFDEVILLNERGEVAECTSANIFVVNEGQVSTPPLFSGCLPGVTRATLLEDVRVAGIEIAEETLMSADLESADEVFVTSTTRELLPVASIEGLKLREPRPGVRECLQAAFTNHVRGYVAARRAMPAVR
jgi:branched-chain amino acid aminotransferase